jgi:hypothetical protein
MNIDESTELLLFHFLPLPKELQREVIDFAEFLKSKSNSNEFSKNLSELPITEEQKKLLDNRYLEFKSNPDRQIPWQEVKDKLYKKFGRSVFS